MYLLHDSNLWHLFHIFGLKNLRNYLWKRTDHTSLTVRVAVIRGKLPLSFTAKGPPPSRISSLQATTTERPPQNSTYDLRIYCFCCIQDLFRIASSTICRLRIRNTRVCVVERGTATPWGNLDSNCKINANTHESYPATILSRNQGLF